MYLPNTLAALVALWVFFVSELARYCGLTFTETVIVVSFSYIVAKRVLQMASLHPW